jgi:hypothetical protein
MTSDYSSTLLLSSLIRIITTSVPGYGPGSHVVCILVDEVEGFNDLPPASRLSIQQGVRDLFNSCTEHLCIALAATASDASEMWGILDQPLMQRLSRQPIQFRQLESDEAKEFMLKIMDLNRIASFTSSREFPFTEDGLDAFVHTCPQPLTPRKLLVSAQRLAFQQYKEKVSSGDGIDASDIQDFTAWGAS